MRQTCTVRGWIPETTRGKNLSEEEGVKKKRLFHSKRGDTIETKRPRKEWTCRNRGGRKERATTIKPEKRLGFVRKDTDWRRRGRRRTPAILKHLREETRTVRGSRGRRGFRGGEKDKFGGRL